MSVTPLPVRRVHVYELVNVARRESLMAITGEDESAVRARLRDSRPIEASAWDLERDDVSVTLHGANLAPDSARDFVELYLKAMRPRTWRYRVWTPGT